MPCAQPSRRGQWTHTCAPQAGSPTPAWEGRATFLHPRAWPPSAAAPTPHPAPRPWTTAWAAISLLKLTVSGVPHKPACLPKIWFQSHSEPVWVRLALPAPYPEKVSPWKRMCALPELQNRHSQNHNHLLLQLQGSVPHGRPTLRNVLGRSAWDNGSQKKSPTNVALSYFS